MIALALTKPRCGDFDEASIEIAEDWSLRDTPLTLKVVRLRAEGVPRYAVVQIAQS